MLVPHLIRKIAQRRACLIMLAASMAGGCQAPPSHTARFWMTSGQTFALHVEGAQPTVQLAPDFGPLSRVEWKHPDGVTTFHGVPAGGEMLLTLRQGDELVFTDELGSRVEVTIWNSTGYALTEPNGTIVAMSAATKRPRE